MSTFKYKAFISYSWKDRAAAEALHRALETFRIPKSLKERAGERLVPIFRDRDEEAAGANLRAAIEEGLDTSEFLIVVCSPNSAASPWVNKEIAYFRKKRDAANILSYVIAGEPGPECFPPSLLFESSVDGAVTAEAIEAPLAADARENGDGPRLARLKIIAAMLRVGLDDLVRRDAQRRTRNLRMAIGGLSAATLLFAGIAGVAAYQWNDAVKNEQRAAREAMKAERVSEFMVSLFEVPDPGESRGRQVTAREILDKGVKTIEQDLADEPDIQASLMHTMGRTYTGLGLYPDAARILDVARKKRVDTGADPADVYATENALARALFEKGDLDAAKKVYSKLVAEAEADIAKGGWRVDYAVAMTGMGETVLYADDAKSAQPYYERARDLLAANDMGKSEEMAEALVGLAGAYSSRDIAKSAEGEYFNALSILSSLPGNHDLQKSVVWNDLGNLYYSTNRLISARKALEKSLDLDSRIYTRDHPEILRALNNLARLEYEIGNSKNAKHLLQVIMKNSAKIERKDDFDLVFPLNTMGELLSDEGREADALPYFSEAIGKVTSDHRLIGTIMMNVGRAHCALTQISQGLAEVAGGRRALDDHYDADNWRYGVADEYESRCRAAIGEREKARALAKSGYERLREQLGDEHYFTQRARAWMEGLEK